MDLNEMSSDRFSSRQVALRRDVITSIQERISRLKEDALYFSEESRFKAERSEDAGELIVGLKKVGGSIQVLFLKDGSERSLGLDWGFFTVVDLVTIERLVCAI